MPNSAHGLIIAEKVAPHFAAVDSEGRWLASAVNHWKSQNAGMAVGRRFLIEAFDTEVRKHVKVAVASDKPASQGVNSDPAAEISRQLCRVDKPKDDLAYAYDRQDLARRLAAVGPSAANNLADAVLATEDPNSYQYAASWLGMYAGPAMAFEMIAERYPQSPVPAQAVQRLIDTICSPGYTKRVKQDWYTIEVLSELVERLKPTSPLASTLRNAAQRLKDEGKRRGDSIGSAKHMVGNRMLETGARIQQRFGPPSAVTTPKAGR
ncbi:MAG: hypothetical protein HY695_04240 [Deltaproteobacteria bacterium]|nr:hypothetical protein [Deltaproteobacteria bacterium]